MQRGFIIAYQRTTVNWCDATAAEVLVDAG
jgi:hypothetical protein